MDGAFRFTGKVTYADGSEESFTCGNAAVAAWERYAMRNKLPMGKDSPPTFSSIVIAHHALGITEGVDAWMEKIDGIELQSNAAEIGLAVPPTPPGASTA